MSVVKDALPFLNPLLVPLVISGGFDAELLPQHFDAEAAVHAAADFEHSTDDDGEDYEQSLYYDDKLFFHCDFEFDVSLNSFGKLR